MKTDSATTKSERKKLTASGKFGVFLILLSGVFFFTMIAVPWMPLTNGQKLTVGGGLFVGVQVAWWVGAALVGPSAIQAIRDIRGKIWNR